ncbi:MAG: type VII secretion protein EccB [Pseudonocardia sp.]|nr:type VII secretion protein EccB [Pseudonocardia sp.]
MAAPTPPTAPSPPSGLVRAPATKDQADAHRFGLRRFEAALVRADPVLAHEQLRSQRRAVAAGAVLGVLGLGAAAVIAAVSSRPDWTNEALVVGGTSGAMYAVAHGPDRLVPVANAAAGRLVAAALGTGGGSGAVEPTVVRDEDLARAARTPAADVPGAVAVRTDGPVTPEAWGICERVGRGLPRRTVVLAGALAAPGPEPGPGLVLADADGGTWAVIGGVRHRVDLADRVVVAALGLTGHTPRQVGPGLLSAIAEGPALRTPVVRPGSGPAGLREGAGTVLVVRPLDAPARYYAVLADGVQQIPGTLAEALRARSGADPVPATPGTVAAVPVVDELDAGAWPVAAVPWADPADGHVVCWTWTRGGTGVLTGAEPPLASGSATVELAGADGSGPRTDTVVLHDPGPVRARTAAGGGTLWLVSGAGVAYGVADEATGAALGVRAVPDAPEAALRLLPAGPALDLAGARAVVDGLPVR